MLKLELPIPDDVIYELKSTTKRGNSIEDRLRLNLAIGMFVNQEISLAKCAQIAGHNLGDFIIALNELGIPSVHYSEEMLADDLKFADEGNSCMKTDNLNAFLEFASEQRVVGKGFKFERKGCYDR